MALSNLFEERPIWIRRSIHERLLDDGMEVSIDQLKRLLFRAGYSFSTGPFGRFWIRKGYDPRKDPESRIYQKVDFRIPPLLRHLGNENTTDELKHKWKDLCGFKVFPDKSFTTLQLFELNDDFIQQEIGKPAEQKSCTRTTGWLSRPTIDLLRLYVSMKFLSILPGEDAGRMLKSISQRFESLKSLPSLKDDSRSMEKEHEFEHRGSNSDAAVVQQNELNDDEIQCEAEDEPEHEAEDEDDDEEEVDEYGSLNGEFNFEGGGEDENFSLEAGSYPIGGDISKDYLQELFSFPPLVDGQDYEQNVEDADTSEEEYQIFEQESDSDLPEDGDGDGDGDGFS
ncbi:hypothetical protein QJS04_geneDACA013900 [Acorus gramineus]|uniref:Transcription factor IIIC subunit 5 HTH domain-containing protein n=1 Tax=Acorus gramineus TaxID=55184 RepID=A0AAV9AWN8_ACOGR|nr:hypothetical protein QJS04_geneDACA013900 [Acorus gramineus]